MGPKFTSIRHPDLSLARGLSASKLAGKPNSGLSSGWMPPLGWGCTDGASARKRPRIFAVTSGVLFRSKDQDTSQDIGRDIGRDAGAPLQKNENRETETGLP